MKKFFYVLLLIFLSINVVDASEELFVKKDSVSNENYYYENSYFKLSSEAYLYNNEVFFFNEFINTESVTVNKYDINVLLMQTDKNNGFKYKLFNNDEDYEYIYPYDNNYLVFDVIPLVENFPKGMIITYKFNVYLFDNNFNKTKELTISELFNQDFFSKKVDVYSDSEGIVLMLRHPEFSYDHGSCEMYKIDNNFSKINQIDCSTDNIVKYYPTIAFEAGKSLLDKAYDVRKKYLAVIEDEKLNFYNNDKLIFSKEVENKKNEKFIDVSIFKNAVAVIKERKIRDCETLEILYETYSDEILIYDYEGNLLQTIHENASYLNLFSKEENNELYVYKRYTDGICTDVYEGHLNCPTRFSYDVYTLNEKNDNYEIVLGVSYNKPPGLSLKNPDTGDIALVILSGMITVSLIMLIKYKKMDF